MDTGIFIQARTGSTRLPGKILRAFHDGRSLLEVIIERLRSNRSGLPLHVATTDRKRDLPIVELCLTLDIPYYRGSEHDVLKRTIEAAQQFGCDRIIRVCADNPFINIDYLEELTKAADENGWDYICHSVQGKPAMKTHFGLFAEYVKLSALHQVARKTENPLFREHVTNYIYTHEQEFRVRFLAADELAGFPNLRLTIDTLNDFRTAGKIYAELKREDLEPNVENIVNVLKRYPELEQQMARQINKNKKT